MDGYLVLIDLIVVAGAAAVIPAALGRGLGPWIAVAASTALAFSIEPGPLGLVLALPWAVVAGSVTVAAAVPVVRRGRWPTLDEVAVVAAPAFATVAGAALLVSCLGWDGFGISEPIIRLTVVHFTFAGTATTALAQVAREVAPTDRRRRLATGGLVLAMASPPVVALGFVGGAAVAQVGGAVLMTAAAYAIAASHLIEGWPARRSTAGRLLAVSGLSVWVPMVLAVAWALAQHTGGPALSIPDMARIHGSLNAFGFVGCGLAARVLATHGRLFAPVPVPVRAASVIG